VIALDVLWWVGWVYFAAWTILPFAVAEPVGGLAAGLVALVVLGPWSALVGMAGVHRLLPASPAGTFHLPGDAGSIRWAVRGWAPSVYLTVFQPVCFLSPAFQRLALRAFGARLGSGALLTSRTIVREPHRVRVGQASLVGEFAHLICSYQPHQGVLVVADIDIGDRVFVGAYCHLGPGAVIGSNSVLEYAVRVGAQSVVGEHVRIGAGSSIYNSVRIGDRARIGKGCLITSGAVIPAGARIPDAAVIA
jgi:acetyltransferase-like isoleucine patch superfamily enzyme